MACVICNNPLSDDEIVTVKSLGLKNLIKSSLLRGDKLDEVFRILEVAILHKKCRNKYCYVTSNTNAPGEISKKSLTPQAKRSIPEPVENSFNSVEDFSEEIALQYVEANIKTEFKTETTEILKDGIENCAISENADVSETKLKCLPVSIEENSILKLEHMPISITGVSSTGRKPIENVIPQSELPQTSIYEEDLSKPFPFKSLCIFCLKDIGDMYKEKNKKRPVHLRDRVCWVQRADTKDTILKHTARKTTPIREAIIRRIKDVDLVEVGAGYHKNCYYSLLSTRNRKGYPVSPKIAAAMEIINRYVEESHQTEFRVSELSCLLEGFKPRRATIITKLRKTFGNKVTVKKCGSDIFITIKKDSGRLVASLSNDKKIKKVSPKLINQPVRAVKMVEEELNVEIIANEVIQKIPVKKDKGNTLFCHVCLSSDRKLDVLGEYSDVYRKICSDVKQDGNIKLFLLCWECKAVLKNVKLFREKVQTTQKFLKYSTFIMAKPKCLSALAACTPKTTLVYYKGETPPPYEIHEVYLDENIGKTKQNVAYVEDTINGIDEQEGGVDENVEYDENDGKMADDENIGIDEKIRDDETIVDDEKIYDDDNIVDDEKVDDDEKTSNEQIDDDEQMNGFDTLDSDEGRWKSDSPTGSTEHRNLRKSTLNKRNTKFQLSNNQSDEEGSDTSSSSHGSDPDCEFYTKKKTNSSTQAPRRRRSKIQQYSTVFREFDISTKIRRVPIRPQTVDYWRDCERQSVYFTHLKEKCEKCICAVTEENHNEIVHSKNNPFHCRICEASFPTKEAIQLHIADHYYLSACQFCGYQCYDVGHMVDHVQMHKRAVQCLQCEYCFNTIAEFNDHFDGIHKNSECDYCGKEFNEKHDVEKHIQREHMPQVCTICQTTYSSYNALQKHKLKIHRVERTEAAYCVQCDRQFNNQHQYKAHISYSVKHAHEVDRPIKPPKKKSAKVKCPGCPNEYSDNNSMMSHFNLVHAKKLNFLCKYCNKAFPRSTNLKTHVARIHEGYVEPRNKFCHLCGQGFQSNKILTNHIRTHTGERPYECSQCDAKFAQRAALICHVKHVHEKIPRKYSNVKVRNADVQNVEVQNLEMQNVEVSFNYVPF